MEIKIELTGQWFLKKKWYGGYEIYIEKEVTTQFNSYTKWVKASKGDLTRLKINIE